MCLSIVGLSAAQGAKAAMKMPTNIPAQGLGPALKDFAQTRNVQVLYFSQVAKDLRTGGASGYLTADEELTQLLNGTGLTYRYVDDKAVTILPVGATLSQEAGATSLATGDDRNGANAPAQEGKKNSSGGFRAAPVDQGTNSQSSAVGSNPPSSQDQGVKLEEIIVTAQKREERLIDVPISIFALSAENLQQREIKSIDDLGLAVPGMSIQSSGNQRRIELRGISNFGGSNSALIGMYLDEADVTSQSAVLLDLSTHDLERVEVLRGPQGTLYGEGSAGGTIHFITKSPVLSQFGMNADVAALFTQDGAPGQRVETAINVPLIDNVLGIRIAGAFDHEGGWIDQPATDRKDFNEEDKTDVRVKALWLPTTQWSVNAMADIHRNNASSNAGEDANGNYTQAFGLTTTPRLNDQFDIYNLTSDYDFVGARLLSSTSYVKQEKVMANYGYALPILQPPAPAFEVDLIPFTNDARILTEELRLASDGNSAWQWTAGGFYRRFQFDQSQNYLFGPPGPPPAVAFTSATNSLSKSWAAFGDTSYKLADRLTLGAGLRYFHDSQDFSNGSSVQSTDFHSLNPRAYVQFKVSDALNVYTSAAKGFRSGGFNNAIGEPSYGPESVWTEELGTKMSVLGGHLSADLAIFHSDYTNYQITGVSPFGPPGLPITSNGGDARVNGVEWDLSWQPWAGWTLSANGDYVNSSFYKVSVTSSDHAVGDPLDFVPKYALTFSAQRDFRVVGKAAFARLDFNEQGRQTFRLRNVAGPTPWFFSESNVIHMLNFNSHIQWNDNLSLGVFAQNLLNDRGQIDPFAIESTAARSRPRTYGVQFGVKFD